MLDVKEGMEELVGDSLEGVIWDDRLVCRDEFGQLLEEKPRLSGDKEEGDDQHIFRHIVGVLIV